MGECLAKSAMVIAKGTKSLTLRDLANNPAHADPDANYTG